jgi:hypothetical protein
MAEIYESTNYEHGRNETRKEASKISMLNGSQQQQQPHHKNIFQK